MAFDEEELDPHGECAAEIARLNADLIKAQADGLALRNYRDGLVIISRELEADRDRLAGENEKLRRGIGAAIRAADLAIFVIRKQDVMPNSSWQAGFERDLAAAKTARGPVDEQNAPEG